jgi:WD40 repeat protein
MYGDDGEVIGVPRGERPLDTADGMLPRFATDLRRLREQAGSPPYRELARRAHYSAGTLSDAAGGRKLPGLSVLLAYVRACDGDVTEWERYWHRVTTELAAEAAAGATDANPVATQLCPYVGLAAFQTEDADRFHGRDAITEELVRRLGERRFLAVFGASGSGKSSLLRAGLAARLRGSAADKAVRVVVFTPGVHPVRECALALSDVTGMPPASLRDELLADPDALHLRVRQAVADSARDVVLIVDQFEEVFTLCQDADERDRFLTALLTAVVADGSATRVVLGIRTDFYTHCAAHPPLVDALRDAQVLVGAMSTEELRTAITQPAVNAGCTIEGALVATIMAEAAAQTGVLPLVSHALWETWRRRRGNALTLAGYQGAGGITHAIAHTAEAVHAELDDTQQRIARDVFLRLSALGEDTQDTKRRVHRHELDLDDPDVTVVLEHLVRARLVTVDGDNVDLAHEALIRCWPRLRDWQATDREGLLTHRRLTEATEAWETLHRDEGSLYRGSRLVIARDWAARADATLTRRERAFLDASVAVRERERRAVGRRTWLLRWLVLSLLVLLVAGTGLVVSARGQHDAADAQRVAAVSRQLAAEADQTTLPDTAMLLALDAYHQSPTTEARSALLSAQARYAVTRLIGQHGMVVAAALSPDGRVLATAGDDATVTLYDAHSHTPIGTIPGTNDVHALAFSPDGATLAGAGNTGTRTTRGSITLWRVADRSDEASVVLPSDDVTSVRFSPDGRALAVGTDDHRTLLWQFATDSSFRSLSARTQDVQTVAYSPDGHLLATGDDDGTVQVWNPDTGALVTQLAGPAGRIWDVAFSPDGHLLAVANPDGTVGLWQVGSWRLAASIAADTSGLAGSALALAVSPDDHTLATVGQSGVELWDIATRALVGTLTTEAGGTSLAAQFSPDGRTLVTTDGSDTLLWDITGPTLTTWPVSTPFAVVYSHDGLIATGDVNGDVQLWQPQGRTPLATLHGTGGPVTSLAFSPDGALLAVGSAAGPARLWHVRTDGVVTSLARPGVSDEVQDCVAFSRDGHTLAIADGDGTVALWDVGTDSLLATLPADGFPVVSVAFAPDGHTLAAVDGGTNNPIQLWDLSSARIVATFGGTNRIGDVAFAPDGATLVTTGSNGPATLWSTRTHDEIATLAASTGDDLDTAAVFSPDGRMVATTGADGAIELWGAAGHDLVATLTGTGASVRGVAFSPDGRTLASVGNEHGTYLWQLDPGRVVARICRVVGPITPARWSHLTPNLPYQAVCG